MDREELYRENESFLRMLAKHYAINYEVDFDDLFQEGAFGVLVVFNNYSNEKREDELLRLSRKVANRFMYRYIKSELKRRSFLQ